MGSFNLKKTLATISLVAMCAVGSIANAAGFGIYGSPLISSSLLQTGTGPVAPQQSAFFATGGTDGHVNVEFRNSVGVLIPLTDTNSVTYSAVTVTVPHGGPAYGLGYLITQTKPDGTHYLNQIPNGAAYGVFVVTQGTVTINTAGTIDSSAGGGNGIAATLYAPSALTPTVLTVGCAYTMSPGGIVNAIVQGNAITIASLPLPTGASTSALQTTGNTSLSTIATNTTGSATAANQTTGITLLGGGLPSSLSNNSLRANAVANFTTSSTGEATNAVTTTPATLVSYGGTAPSNPLTIAITNDGAVDAYVSTISGGHTVRCPAGATTYVNFIGTLYCMTETGTTTLYCTEWGN